MPPIIPPRPKRTSRTNIRPNRNRWQRKSFKGIFLSTFVGFFLIGSIVGYFLEYPQKMYSYLSQKMVIFSGVMGLKIDEVFVEGRQHSPQEAILNAVQAKRNHPILAYDLEIIQKNLEKIDWVKSATVQRRLPNLLYIHMVERKPIALWHHQQNFFLVDQEGIVITTPVVSYFKELPVVVGADAPVQAPQILATLENFPKVREKLSSLVRIRQRRWDLTLDNTIQVKLPEEKVEDALARLSLLIEQKRISKEETSMVDLRIPKQIILRLSKAAAVRLKVKGKET
ncbi:MAG: cell division protein FtsQ/DivIB [Alphaproteobacteria bacterium]|nr:cell division protein FtsQ/DivIB [Alphaproteobacteria bacterium]